MSVTLARERLIHLLDYTGAFAKLQQRDAVPQLQLQGGFEGGDDSSFVLHEAVLRQLADVSKSSSEKCVHLGSRQDLNSSVWVRLRRPDGEGREGSQGKLLCSVYAAMFSAHQEALREGRGAQVTVGVGQLRWKRPDGRIIDHPLITLPAELQLDDDGALVIRMADGAQASLWPMPGVEDCSPALGKIAEYDKATPLPLLGRNPPAPADRDAWEQLLKRASYELSHDAKYEDAPPRVNAKGGLATTPDATPRIHNTFTVWAHHDAGGLGVARDLSALQDSLRACTRCPRVSTHALQAHVALSTRSKHAPPPIPSPARRGPPQMYASPHTPPSRALPHGSTSRRAPSCPRPSYRGLRRA